MAEDGLAGPYLAGRLASLEYDYSAAAEYFARALGHDPDNTSLLENALISEIGRGDVAAAIEPAARLSDLGQKSQIADLVLLTELVRAGDYAGALAALDKGKSAGVLVDGLFRAWVQVGLGQMSEATASFDAVAGAAGSRAFGLYHKALALASVGDYEGADKIFSGESEGPLRATRRGILAHAQILSQLERNPAAVELIDKVIGDAKDPVFEALRAELQAGKPVPFSVVNDAREGIAEVFFTVAAALNGESQTLDTLAYARMAEYLAPKETDATLLSASILEAQGQHALAIETYDRIPREDPAFLSAELGRIDALVADGRQDTAIEALRQLARAYPNRADVWGQLGDTLRRQERYTEAAEAYDKALASFAKEDPGQWVLYYTRGIARERIKNWPGAEADFRKALALRPDQPAVLNYLGYSYLERKENFDEALMMIEKAAAERPDDGAIVDSLGWALYSLGRYEEAVGRMEQAIELMPVDPVVNDHLGDVYWAVGRKLEAEFQWKRALSFGPDTEEEAARIRRKLEVGLDAVLKEEGAEPLAVTKNGN
ncbi:MAG: tetratricopeptide repeat protein [Rhodobacteraceae bacterium]|nr:tetratricopeptide repeat protein [Paracoccaceae bacterium]